MTKPPTHAGSLVSVITPCYNAAPFLAETARSVATQSYPWIEHLVVDDGSTDGSWEVIEGLGDSVRAFRRENGGAARARNFGAAHARGEWILFLDADDLIAPDTVEALLEAAAGRTDSIAACRWSRLVRRGGGWVTEPAEVPFPLTGHDPLAAWLRGEWIAGCSLLWPTRLFRELGGYDESLTADEDGDLMYRALARGTPLLIAAGGESFYRSHGDTRMSLSVDVYSEHRFYSRLRVFEKLEDELRRQDRWENYRTALGIAYHGLAQRTFASRPELAREALRRGEAYAGRRAIAPTLPGRLLVGLLGMDGKERIVQALARVGIMTASRRELLSRGRHHPKEEPAEPEAEVPQ